MRHDRQERITECGAISVRNRQKNGVQGEVGEGEREAGEVPLPARNPVFVQKPAGRPWHLLPRRPVAILIGENQERIRKESETNQATVRPVFIFAATSTEIRQPIAR